MERRMKNLQSIMIRQMRVVTKQMAIQRVPESTAHWVLNDMIDTVKVDDEFIDHHKLGDWKQTFIHDYYEKGIVACKSCKREDSALEMRGDVCTNCY